MNWQETLFWLTNIDRVETRTSDEVDFFYFYKITSFNFRRKVFAFFCSWKVKMQFGENQFKILETILNDLRLNFRWSDIQSHKSSLESSIYNWKLGSIWDWEMFLLSILISKEAKYWKVKYWNLVFIKLTFNATKKKV